MHQWGKIKLDLEGALSSIEFVYLRLCSRPDTLNALRMLVQVLQNNSYCIASYTQVLLLLVISTEVRIVVDF